MRPRFDVAIQTVIGPELDAILRAFAIPEGSKVHDKGSTFWPGKVESAASDQTLEVVVHCQGEPGTQAASTAATKLLERYNPRFMLLSGIAAGRRGKVKIGDVAIPRAVADFTQKVAEPEGVASRPIIDRLPYSVTQLLRAFRPDSTVFVNRFRTLYGPPPVPPAGMEEEYAKNVAANPAIHEAAFASQDLLLRNPEVLEELASLHQQIRIGEMEAAGFVTACESRNPPVPWLVVRGVSDFGDQLKGDDFHRMASVAAAAYVAVFLERGFDVRVFGGKKKKSLAKQIELAAAADIAAVGARPADRLESVVEIAAAVGTSTPLFKKGQLVKSRLNNNDFALRNGKVLDPKVGPNLLRLQWPGREPNDVYADSLELEDEQPELVEDLKPFQSPLLVLHSRPMDGTITLHAGPTFLQANVTWWNTLPPEFERLSFMKGSGTLRAIVSGVQLHDEEKIADKFAAEIDRLGGNLIRVDDLWKPENVRLLDILITSIRGARLVDQKCHPRFGAMYDFAARAGDVARAVITAFHERLASIETPGVR